MFFYENLYYNSQCQPYCRYDKHCRTYI